LPSDPLSKFSSYFLSSSLADDIYLILRSLSINFFSKLSIVLFRGFIDKASLSLLILSLVLSTSSWVKLVKCSYSAIFLLTKLPIYSSLPNTMLLIFCESSLQIILHLSLEPFISFSFLLIIPSYSSIFFCIYPSSCSFISTKPFFLIFFVFISAAIFLFSLISSST